MGRCLLALVGWLATTTLACAPGRASDDNSADTDSASDTADTTDNATCPDCDATWAVGAYHWQTEVSANGAPYLVVVQLELLGDGTAVWTQQSCQLDDTLAVARWHPTSPNTIAIVPAAAEPSFNFWDRNYARWDLRALDHPTHGPGVQIDATLSLEGTSGESFESYLRAGARCLVCEPGGGPGVVNDCTI